MTICLGKSWSFDLLCVSFVNVYQFVCVCFHHLVLQVDVGFDCFSS